MKKVLVIGAGFGGLSALRKLAQAKNNLKVTLLDRKSSFDFLPMLPDIIGRGVSTQFLYNDIKDLIEKLGIEFIQKEIIVLDLEKNIAKTKDSMLNYDYLLIACGSETNFYGQEQIARNAFTLDNVKDAEKILQALGANRFDNFLVAGGGYTGIEVATNLRLFLNKAKSRKKIMIIEVSPSILGPLPIWMKNYVSENLKQLNINILLNCRIEGINGGRIYLSNGEKIARAMLIWTAGVKTANFISALNVNKTQQGRIRVDEYLRFKENCFAIGDAAEFSSQGKPLRMAVQFSIAQGEIAADNILRHMRKLALRRYQPLDLGYVIPMANNQSCGKIAGINMKGSLPTLLHYLMCIYRSFSLKNKLGIVKDLYILKNKIK